MALFRITEQEAASICNVSYATNTRRCWRWPSCFDAQ